MLEQDIQPFPPSRFIGAGVYVLYYIGDFPACAALTEVNKDNQYLCPIYVGKAVPEGVRKGGQGEDVDPGTALYKRLNDHAKSIEAATNLDLSDFRCRFLAVDDIWISLAESMVIERFKPVWNCLLEGFGNHAPGHGRSSMITPSWNWFHPSRAGAVNLQPFTKPKEQLDTEIRNYLADTIN